MACWHIDLNEVNRLRQIVNFNQFEINFNFKCTCSRLYFLVVLTWPKVDVSFRKINMYTF